MKKLFSLVVVALVFGALSATASLALDSVQVSGEIFFKKGIVTPPNAVVYMPFSDGVYGTELRGKQNFMFYFPLHFGATEAQIGVWSKTCTSNALLWISPNSCTEINLLCR